MSDVQVFFLVASGFTVALAVVMAWGAWKFRGEIF